MSSHGNFGGGVRDASESMLAAFLGGEEALEPPHHASQVNLVNDGENTYFQEDTVLVPNSEYNPDSPPPLDPREASREELLSEAMNYFEYCASYHEPLTKRMLAMLSTTMLRHLVTLLQEIIDPDMSEERWRTKEGGEAQGGTIPTDGDDILALADDDTPITPLAVEDDFLLTTERGDGDADDDSDATTDSQLTPLQISDHLAMSGTVIGGSDLGGSSDLFSPPPDDKERWSQGNLPGFPGHLPPHA